jgi:hypothetical protein
LALAALLAAGGCASARPGAAGGSEPAWFVEGEAARIASGYPDLSEAVRSPKVEHDAAHWESLAGEVLAGRAEVLGSERSAPAPDGASAAAQEFARQALDELRQTERRY